MKKVLISAICSFTVLASGSSFVFAKDIQNLMGAEQTSTASETNQLQTTQANQVQEAVVMSETLVAAVTSSFKPLDGQKHRSSGNFSIQNLPSGTYALKFVVDNPPENLHFNVMKDVSWGSDPVVWSKAYPGYISYDVKTSRSFYIADPVNATGDFTVKIFALHH